MKKITTLVLTTIFIISTYAQDVISPDDYLGYELGTQFTIHHQAVSYLKYVARNSVNVEYQSYGKSSEGRELGVTFISSQENLAILDQLRKNNPGNHLSSP